MSIKVSPYPIPELKEFLRPFRQQFYRAENQPCEPGPSSQGWHTLERYSTGLLADIEHKSGAAIAAAVAGLSDSALYRLMTETQWEAKALNGQRTQTMRQQAVAGDGVLVVDDT